MKTAPDISPNPSAPASLPPADLRRILEEKDRLLAQQQALNAELRKHILLLEEQLRLARLRKFGARSEKLPFQGELFDEAELEVSLEDVEQALAEAEAEPKKPRKRRTKADGFDENLPRIQVRLTLDEEEKAGANKTFFSKVKEELDIVPAQARVIEYWQEKAVFDTPEGEITVKVAARPIHPLGKCLASVQLLAWILVAKYADALPLYRLEGILKRHGGQISRTTMANWIIRLDDVFKPLINLLREQQLDGDYLQADETRLQVLKETGNKRVFGLVIDFGTSQSPKSTRPLTTHWCPSRPGHQALRNNFASSLLLRTWLPMTGRRVRRPTLFSLWRKARRENSAASRLLGSTSLRFALHGWQRSAQSDKWMWVIRGGPPDRPAVLFEYDPSRSEEVPLRLLDGFKGTLQTDGYAGYNRVCRENGLTRIGCWDHARRKFVEASKAAPVKKKGTKVSKADVAIGKIRKLYAIEKRIEKLPPEEKTRQRQQLAQPVLDDLKAWLEKNSTRVPRDSLTYKAIQYTLNQWELLIGYLADGRLNISNALAENAIRPFAVGRRNWLFADTPRGAKASATIYSLIETAKANGLEPFAYLYHVLRHIGGASTVEDIEALLPWKTPLKKMQEG